MSMIRSLHQPPDSASVSVRRSAGVGQDVSLGDERGRHGENRTSRRRTYRSRLPRSSIWVTSQTYTKRTEWSSTRFGAAKGKGRTASIQNETMEIFGWRCEKTLYRYRQKNLEEFFTMEGTLVACKEVDGLFKALNMSHCSDEWRLFIDSSKVSLKAVLLTMGMCYLLFLLHMHLDLKKVVIAWSSYCNT